jgi:diacylglycerol kinase family enzyme
MFSRSSTAVRRRRESGVAAARVALLTQRFAAAGITGTCTDRTARARRRSSPRPPSRSASPTVLVWGGDGTINEVGSIVAGTSSALGIVPAGSGNGFAA